MKPSNTIPLMLLLIVFLGSCASPYRAIQPQSLAFDDGSDTLTQRDVIISWQYNVLWETGNKYYANLEKESDISVIGVRIQNTGAYPFHFPGDIQIIAGEETVGIIPPDEVKNYLTQVGSRSPEDAFNYFGQEVEGLLIAGAYTAAALGLQHGADKNLQKDLKRFYLDNLTVPPGGEKVGLIILPVQSWMSLNFVLLPMP